MPRAPQERNILCQGTTAIDQRMRRNSQMRYLGEIGMLTDWQRIGEQRINPAAAEFARRQRNSMHHDQAGKFIIRSVVAVG